MNAAETHETVHWESGMRYQLQTTTSCGSSWSATQHVVVLTEPHVREPLCGTTSPRRSHGFRDFCDFRLGRAKGRSPMAAGPRTRRSSERAR